MQYGIRRGDLGDADVVADYNARLALETEGLRLEAAALAKGVRAVLGDASRGLYFVAEVDGAVAGQLMVTFEWSDWRNGWVWWIQSVYVAPEHRRKGVFRALYSHVEQAAKEAAVKGLRLYVDQHNALAQKTYARLGMQPSNYVIFEQVPLENRTGSLRSGE